MSVTTFYPSDNAIIQGANDADWATVRALTTGTASKDASQYMFARHLSGNYSLWVFFANIDTSALPDGDVISAATFSLYSLAVGTTDSRQWNVYDSTATDTIIGDDFNNRGSTAYATALDFSGFGTSTYVDFTLNSTGLAAISKTGLTKLCVRDVTKDVADSAPTNETNSYWQVNQIAQTGTSQDPKLVITHAEPITSIKTINGLAKASVKTINGLAIASVKTLNGLS